MSVSNADLTRLLDECGLKHLPELAGAVPFLLKSGETPLMVTVAANNDGQLVQFRTINLLLAKEPHYRLPLLTALIHASHQYKLVKFGWDPEDGEVVAYIDVFIGDCRLTKKQFRRCLNVLSTVVVRTLKRCEQIKTTGRDPGDQGGTPEELLGLLTQMMEEAADEARSKGKAGSDTPQPKKKTKGPGGLDDLFGDLLGGDK